MLQDVPVRRNGHPLPAPCHGLVRPSVCLGREIALPTSLLGAPGSRKSLLSKETCPCPLVAPMGALVVYRAVRAVVCMAGPRFLRRIDDNDIGVLHVEGSEPQAWASGHVQGAIGSQG